jgi:glycosyltransferase involved in cell wall biosynthesis
LRSLEKTLLNVGAYSSCTSKVLSEALAAEYGCVPPVVVYNAFAWSERNLLDGELKDRRDAQLPSIHWFSQSIGPSRGLEDLFAALPYVAHEVEIHLRGRAVPGLEQWIGGQVPAAWRARIFIHDLVTNDELLSRIAEHDIGFAGEGTYCRNKDLTVSNKILQYLLAGLAVVASDTQGQREVAKSARGAVQIYRSGNPKSLAAKLNALLSSAEKLRRTKAAALAAAEKTFCWERQAPVLLQSVENALDASHAGPRP